jgi:hypothetical protein
MPIGDVGKYTDRSRHFVRLNDGRVVPRAEAENIQARRQGFAGNYERRQAFRQMKRSPGYQRDVREARTNRERRNREFSKQDYDNAKARLQAEYIRNGNSWQDIDRSPDGALAKYLEESGRRSEQAEYNVGESPSIF